MIKIIEQNTMKLLREYDLEVKMGIAAIDGVPDQVSNDKFREKLIDLKDDHQQLNVDIQKLLDKYHDEGKNESAD